MLNRHGSVSVSGCYTIFQFMSVLYLGDKRVLVLLGFSVMLLWILTHFHTVMAV